MSVVLSRTDLFILFAGDCFFKKKKKIKVLTYLSDRHREREREFHPQEEKNLCIKCFLCVCWGGGGGE